MAGDRGPEQRPPVTDQQLQSAEQRAAASRAARQAARRPAGEIVPTGTDIPPSAASVDPERKTILKPTRFDDRDLVDSAQSSSVQASGDGDDERTRTMRVPTTVPADEANQAAPALAATGAAGEPARSVDPQPGADVDISALEAQQREYQRQIHQGFMDVLAPQGTPMDLLDPEEVRTRLSRASLPGPEQQELNLTDESTTARSIANLIQGEQLPISGDILAVIGPEVWNDVSEHLQPEQALEGQRALLGQYLDTVAHPDNYTPELRNDLLDVWTIDLEEIPYQELKDECEERITALGGSSGELRVSGLKGDRAQQESSAKDVVQELTEQFTGDMGASDLTGWSLVDGVLTVPLPERPDVKPTGSASSATSTTEKGPGTAAGSTTTEPGSDPRPDVGEPKPAPLVVDVGGQTKEDLLREVRRLRSRNPDLSEIVFSGLANPRTSSERYESRRAEIISALEEAGLRVANFGDVVSSSSGVDVTVMIDRRSPEEIRSEQRRGEIVAEINRRLDNDINRPDFRSEHTEHDLYPIIRNARELVSIGGADLLGMPSVDASGAPISSIRDRINQALRRPDNPLSLQAASVLVLEGLQGGAEGMVNPAGRDPDLSPEYYVIGNTIGAARGLGLDQISTVGEMLDAAENILKNPDGESEAVIGGRISQFLEGVQKVLQPEPATGPVASVVDPAVDRPSMRQRFGGAARRVPVVRGVLNVADRINPFKKRTEPAPAPVTPPLGASVDSNPATATGTVGASATREPTTAAAAVTERPSPGPLPEVREAIREGLMAVLAPGGRLEELGSDEALDRLRAVARPAELKMYVDASTAASSFAGMIAGQYLDIENNGPLLAVVGDGIRAQILDNPEFDKQPELRTRAVDALRGVIGRTQTNPSEFADPENLRASLTDWVEKYEARQEEIAAAAAASEAVPIAAPAGPPPSAVDRTVDQLQSAAGEAETKRITDLNQIIKDIQPSSGSLRRIFSEPAAQNIADRLITIMSEGVPAEMVQQAAEALVGVDEHVSTAVGRDVLRKIVAADGEDNFDKAISLGKIAIALRLEERPDFKAEFDKVVALYPEIVEEDQGGSA